MDRILNNNILADCQAVSHVDESRQYFPVTWENATKYQTAAPASRDEDFPFRTNK
jgi:hypothetical protein